MPYIGLSSFLHICSKLVTHYLIRRFNALPRAFFFSTNITEESKSELMTFQCPTSGFLLFYKYVEPNMYHIVSSVSMPYLGLSSFLQNITRLMKNLPQCFNALPRAFFFSTVAGNGGKHEPGNVSMPYLGLSSFLRYVSASLEFTGFANPFLRVII